MSAEKIIYATGRRKKSTARIFLKTGKGDLTINGIKANEYLRKKTSYALILQPLELTAITKKVDLCVTVSGGGETGQAGAIRHGISRALCAFDATMRGALKTAGFLTRDSRMVERKKYGLAGARRRYQYSKR